MLNFLDPQWTESSDILSRKRSSGSFERNYFGRRVHNVPITVKNGSSNSKNPFLSDPEDSGVIVAAGGRSTAQECHACDAATQAELQTKVRRDFAIMGKDHTRALTTFTSTYNGLTRCFKPGEGLSGGLLRDCEIFTNLRLKLYYSDYHRGQGQEGQLQAHVDFSEKYIELYYHIISL